MSPHEPLAGERVLTRGEEKWWRQCPDTPDCWDSTNERPSALMFRWDSAAQLSGAREDKSTAEEAFNHRVNVEKKGSKGTWAVEVETVTSISMRLIDDTANLPGPPASPPGHTYLDARDVTTASSREGKAERERVRSKLLRAAVRLGRQHPTVEAAPVTTEAEGIDAA